MGSYKVTFKDGHQLVFNWPNVKIHGILSKDPHYFFVEGFSVSDAANGLTCFADFIRTRPIGLMSSMFSSKKDPEIPNQVKLRVVKLNSEKQEFVLAEGQ